jgi:hypothetical protein
MKTFLLFTILVVAGNYSSAQSIGGTVGGSTTVCSGNNSGLLTLSGQTGNVVRWQSSTTSGASWSNISNTTANLTYSNLNSTTWYRSEVLLSPSPPNIADYSTPAIVTVDAASAAIVNSSTSVCYGSAGGMLSLSGIFTNIAGWDSSTAASVNWAPISNTTSDQYYSNLTVTTVYRARVKNGVCPFINTTAAIITVNPLSVGGTVLGATTVCSGSNSGALTLVGNTGNVIRWQSSTDGGVSWSNISSTSGSTTCNFSNITATTDFRAVIQNGVCPSANSLPATVTVLPVSDGGNISPTTYSACSGINKGTIVLNGQSGDILRWEYSIDGGITWPVINNTSASQSFNNLTNTIMYRAFVQRGKCAGAYSTTSVILVSPPTIGGIILGNDTVCTGKNSGSLNASGFTGSILNWEYSKNGGVTWSHISNITSNQFYSNLTNTTIYRAMVQSGSCSIVNSLVATIIVNPITVGGSVLSSTYVCDSLTSGTLTLSGHSGNILNWKYSTNAGSTWATIANTTNKQLYAGISSATIFKATVQSPGCNTETSAPAIIALAKPAVASYSFTTKGTTAIFINTSTSNGGTNLWDFGDNTISTITNPAHTYIANGSYSVKLIVSDSCGTDSATRTIIIAGLDINELAYNNPNIKIYPNPFSSEAIIQINFDNIPSGTTFKMFDIFCKEVKSIKIEDRIKLLKLEREDLQSGIYFYKLQSPNQIRATGKVVLE